MNKKKRDCDEIYTDVCACVFVCVGWIARLHEGPSSAATWPRRAGRPEEEEEEEDDAAGKVDTLSNKANHSAVVPIKYYIIIASFFFFKPINIEAGLVMKHFLGNSLTKQRRKRKEKDNIRSVFPPFLLCFLFKKKKKKKKKKPKAVFA